MNPRNPLFQTAALCFLLLLIPCAAHAATVRVGDVSADPGAADVAVSVEVDDASGIAGGDLTLTYDASVLTAKQVRGASLATSNGITVIGNTATAGQVKVSLAGATGIPSGGGALVTVTFDVKADAAPGAYKLELPDVSLSNEQAQTIAVQAATGGTFTVKGGASIQVSVSDVSAEPGATGVEVEVSVDDASGIAGGDLTLTYDASALTATQVRGAPLATGSGITVIGNTATAGQVKVSLAGATGVPSGSGALLTVMFDVKADAKSGAYELKLDDVSLSDEQAQPIAVQSVTSGIFTVEGSEAGIRVSASGASAEPGATGVEIEVSVDDASGIAGGDLTLTYDASALAATQVRGAPLAVGNGLTVIGNTATAGQVKVSLAGAMGISSGSGALVTVAFDVKAGAKSGAYELKLDDVSLSDEQAQAIAVQSVTSGTLTVEGGEAGIRVRVGDVSAAPGATDVEVSIGVDDATGIAGGDLTLTFDDSVLTAVRAVGAELALSNGLTVIGNTATAGQAKVSLAGATGIPSGAGALVTVAFDVDAGAAPGAYELALSVVSFSNEQAQTVAVQSTVPGVFTVKGSTDPCAPSDFDGDGEVGFSDFIQFARAFGKKAGEAGFEPTYDLNGNGSVDFPDFIAFAKCFGQQVR